MAVQGVNFVLTVIRDIDLPLILLLETVELILERLKLARACLKSHFCIRFADLQFFCPAHLILVSFDKLGLCLLVAPILLLVVAYLVVKLFQVVAEGHDFLFCRTNRVFETHDVFIALNYDLLLVPDAVLRGLNLGLHAGDRVLGSLVRVVLCLEALSQIVYLLVLAQVSFAGLTQLPLENVDLPLYGRVASLLLLELVRFSLELVLLAVVVGTCL